MFMNSLKPKALEQLARHPQLFSAAQVRRASTFAVFDHLVTAPLHGFASAEDYWTRASSKQRLRQIMRPTLILNARNDPFLPEQVLPRADQVAPLVELEFPRHGGHVGFVSGPFPGHLHWLPRRLLQFFTQQLSRAS
jgi:hypothetical protein